MKERIAITVTLLFAVFMSSAQQSDNYLVRKAPFSTQKYDEFSPVYYRKSIIFCSNRNPAKISGYSTPDKKGFFKIYSVDTTGSAKGARPLHGDINSHLNNGPATFNSRGDTVYFSRNLIVEGSYKDISGRGNKLGLFYAVLKNGEWIGVTEMRFNDNSWNVTTPFLAPDGKRLYFACDKPDGFGGSDLYYSQWKDGYWNNPVNLGRVINTGGNEAYPFLNESGDLFFSSDSLPGKGGKDIFFSKYTDTTWIKPVGLNAPINSKANDFGFISDNLLNRGYFSSDRGNLLDIYSFRMVYPQFLYCPQQQAPRSCFRFSDDESIAIDPVQLQYTWIFGDGSSASGSAVEHCYEKAGKFTLHEDIVEKKTGRRVFNKLLLQIDLKSNEEPYIISDDIASEGEAFKLTAGIEAAGYEIASAYWDLGKNGQDRGTSITRFFNEEGVIPVKLLVNVRETATGKLRQTCISKTITVGKEAGFGEKETDSADVIHVREGYRMKGIEKIFSAKDAIDNSVFRVQILASEKKIQADNHAFYNLAPLYAVRSEFDSTEKKYVYFIDEQQSLMDAYPAFRNAVSLGYKDAVVKSQVLKGAEQDLWNFKKTYGTSSDLYFMNNGTSLSPKAVPALDELALILKRNEGMKIIVAAYTDNTVSASAGLMLSRKQALGIVNYLIDKGIAKSQMIAAGYGSLRPIAPDFPEEESRRNRRVDFIPVNHNE
jgi:outer membrane protein OmpA-like peptidoglycan-associated protein